MGSSAYILSPTYRRVLFGGTALSFVAGEASSSEWFKIGEVFDDEDIPKRVVFEGEYLSEHNWRRERDLREMACLPMTPDRIINNGCRFDAEIEDRSLREVQSDWPWRAYLQWLDEYGDHPVYFVVGQHPTIYLWAEIPEGDSQGMSIGPIREGWCVDTLWKSGDPIDEDPGYRQALGPGDPFNRRPGVQSIASKG